MVHLTGHTRVIIGATLAGAVLLGCGGSSEVQEASTTTIQSVAAPTERHGVTGCDAPTLDPPGGASGTSNGEVWVYVSRCKNYSVNVYFDTDVEPIPVTFVNQPETGKVLVKFRPANPGTWNLTVVHFDEMTYEMSIGTPYAIEVRD